MTPLRKTNELVDPPLLRAKESRSETFYHVDPPITNSISLPFLNERHSMKAGVLSLRPRLIDIQIHKPIMNGQKSATSPSCPRMRPRGDWNEILEPPATKRAAWTGLNLDQNFELISDSDSSRSFSNGDRCGPMRRRNSNQALAA